MSNEHIIVTGGAGFIGSQMARRLLSDNYKVTILDDLSTGKSSNIPQKADFINIDLGIDFQYSKLKKLSCDAVFHLAGQSSGETSFLDPARDCRSHVLSTVNLLEWAKKAKGLKHFLYASSMAIYGDPLKLPVSEDCPLNPKTFYAAAKLSAENYLRIYQSMGIPTTIFRLFSVYGPGQNLDNRMQGMISIYLSYILDGMPIQVKGAKERFRDFVYMDDVVDAWMLAYQSPKAYGKTYNLCGGVKTTVDDVINLLRQAIHDDEYPVKCLKGTVGDQFGVFGDNRKIKEDLGWSPKVNIQEGIELMVEKVMKGLKV